MKIASLFSLSLLFSVGVNAASWTADEGFISELRIFNGSQILGDFIDAGRNDVSIRPECTGNGFVLNLNDALVEETYSLLMSAQITKKPVRLYYTDTCTQTRSSVNGVRFVD